MALLYVIILAAQKRGKINWIWKYLIKRARWGGSDVVKDQRWGGSGVVKDQRWGSDVVKERITIITIAHWQFIDNRLPYNNSCTSAIHS